VWICGFRELYGLGKAMLTIFINGERQPQGPDAAWFPILKYEKTTPCKVDGGRWHGLPLSYPCDKHFLTTSGKISWHYSIIAAI